MRAPWSELRGWIFFGALVACSSTSSPGPGAGPESGTPDAPSSADGRIVDAPTNLDATADARTDAADASQGDGSVACISPPAPWLAQTTSPWIGYRVAVDCGAAYTLSGAQGPDYSYHLQKW